MLVDMLDEDSWSRLDLDTEEVLRKVIVWLE